MDKQTQEVITRFQNNLSILRKIAGWSAEHLGEILDVTRQTIVNLESGQTKMSKIQYIAIRYIFEKEIYDHKNETLKQLMSILVESNDLDDQYRNQIKKTIDSAIRNTGRRAGSLTASKAAIVALDSLLTTLASTAIVGAFYGTSSVDFLSFFTKDPKK